MIKASVILAFYNRTDYLELVFAGLERQTFGEFEVIIADDGSSPAAVEFIETLSQKVDFPVTHLWQEDKGFRKNKILNKAISAAASEYLVFIDADCVPHSEFVREHVEHAASKICFTGRRVNLSEKITRRLNAVKVRNGFLERNNLLLVDDGIFGKSFDVEKGIYFRNNFLRQFFNKKKRGLLGCNVSVHKSDMILINGFDERYEAPSVGEDSDVEFRLKLAGISVRSLNNIAVQYHLFHKLQERPQANLDLFETVKAENKYFTRFGIKKES